MQRESPFLYLGRMALSGLVVLAAVGLLVWLARAMQSWGDGRERRLWGKRAFPASELPSLGYAATALREGQAAYAPAWPRRAAAFWSGASLALAVPAAHLVYALVILLIGLVTTTGAPPDPNTPAHLYPWPAFLSSLQAIISYLPRVGVAAIALGLLGLAFGQTRQHTIRQQVRYELLGINIPGSWLAGAILSWLIYWLVGVSPITPELHWLPDYIIAWPLVGYLGPLYLHRTQDWALYWLTRYHWPTRTGAAVEYLLMDRFAGARAQQLQVDGSSGTVSLAVAIPRTEAYRLIAQVMGLPGVEHVAVSIDGQLVPPPPDLLPDRLRELARIRGQRHPSQADPSTRRSSALRTPTDPTGIGRV